MENLRLITIPIAAPETNKVPGIIADKSKDILSVEKPSLAFQQKAKESMEKVISSEELKQEIEKEASTVNKLMSVVNNKLKYVIDERSRDGLVVQVIDNESGELIKQIPPEELLELMTRLRDKDNGIGVLIDNNG